MGRRFDTGKQISEATSRTPHGFLLAEAFPTRTGVLVYRRGGRVYRELRPPEELVKALDQIAHAPVTNVHRKASPQDLKHFEGVTRQDVVLQDDGWVRTSVEIMSAKAIRDIEENRRRQLSGGFDRVRFDHTPGRWDPTSQTYALDGESAPESFNSSKAVPFDGIQRDLQYSHAMLCKQSRAGDGAGIRYDDLQDDDGVEIDPAEATRTEPQRSTEMKVKKMLGGVEYEVEESIARAIEIEMASRMDSVEQERDDFKGQVTALTQERDDFKGQVTALTQEKEQRHDAVKPAALKERLAVLATAKQAKVPYLQSDPLSCVKPSSEIMRDAVAVRYDKIDLSNTSEAEIAGMFRVLEQEQPARFDDVFKAAKAEEDPAERHDEGDTDEEVYADFCKRMDTPDPRRVTH
jgi:hypothetical protein